MNETTPARPAAPSGGDRPLPNALIWALATIAGLAVATLYYNQPMLAGMGAELQAAPDRLGLVPMLTQLGYAAGILLLAPLGDRMDRRRIILVKAALLGGALLLSAQARELAPLLVASFAVGLTATLAQDVVSASASLAPAAQRGQVVGKVMTGLLLGILLSRVVSGFVAGAWGWRPMFAGAAVSMVAVVALAWRRLPAIPTTTRLPYLALLGSLRELWQRQAELRRATLAQALLAAGFSAFWSSLAVMLQAAPFHLGSAVAGTFGLAGAAGALIAPVAGRLADRRGPPVVARLGALIATAAFGVMTLATLLAPTAQLWALALCTVGFDLGVQMTLIAHQTIVYGIEPAARSRLNAVLFVGMFLGMAAGAGIGGLLLAHWGWWPVTLFATGAAAGAWALRRRQPLATPRAAA